MNDTPKAPAPAKMGEIATTGDSKDILRGPTDVWQPYQFGILQDIGRDLDIFEKVLQDWEVQSALGQRRLALVSKDWTVEPASDSAIDKAAADWMREQLVELQWDDITDKMHYGVYYGFSVAELLYKRDGSRVSVSEIKVRNRRRFRFDQKGQLRLLTREDSYRGELMPPGKFWTFATGGDNHDNPYGIGLAHWLYWPTYFKNSGVKFWMIFLDKFAMPTAVAKNPFGDSQEKINQLLNALKAVHTDSGVVVPDGVEMMLLEATRSGTTDYETICRYMDKAIQKVTVGQVASSEGTPGKLGNEDLQADVRDDIVKADADLLCESWNRGPGRWLTAWNFPGAKPPRVYRDVEPEEDLNTRAERDSKVKALGFKPTLDYVTETYGEGWEETTSEPGPGDVPDGGGEPGAAFAAGEGLPAEDAFDKAIDMLMLDDESLNSQTEDIIRPVFNLVRRRGPERALNELVALYPRISADRLAESIAKVQFIAYYAGAASAAAD